jgi:uncharacterized membrane protein
MRLANFLLAVIAFVLIVAYWERVSEALGTIIAIIAILLVLAAIKEANRRRRE